MSSIFKKAEKKIESIQPIIKRDQLMNTIPPNTYDCPNNELLGHMIEWRWRFFNINEHQFVEISQKHHNKERLYVDGNGQMIEKIIGDEWNKYIVDEKYYYTEV